VVLDRSPKRDLREEESDHHTQRHQGGPEEKRTFDADREARPHRIDDL
jgi:hypothetical protein